MKQTAMKQLQKRLKRLVQQLGSPAASPAQQERALQELASVLPDPGWIHREELLPRDHPLYRESLILSDALETVANGMFERAPLRDLETVKKDSPLHPWKALIQALHAYYREDPRQVQLRLREIPGGTVPAKLKPLLRELSPLPSEGYSDSRAPLSAPLETLRENISGDNELIRNDLGHLREVIQNDLDEMLPETILLVLRDLLPAFPAAGSRLALWGMQEIQNREIPPGRFLAALKGLLGHTEALRLTALSTLEEDPDLSLLFWIRYILQEIRREGFSSAGSRSQLQAALSLCGEIARAALQEGSPEEWEPDFHSGLNHLTRQLWSEAARILPEALPSLPEDKSPWIGLTQLAPSPQETRAPLPQQAEPQPPETKQPETKPQEPQPPEPSRPGKPAGVQAPRQLELFAC